MWSNKLVIFFDTHGIQNLGATMAAAYYGRLPKYPIQCSKPYLHSNDYGFYISNKYQVTHPNGTVYVFDRDQKDAGGR
jgi:hypothetical protein